MKKWYNPIEPVWQYLKQRLRWTRPKTLNELRQLIREQLRKLTIDTIASITGKGIDTGGSICSGNLENWYYFLSFLLS
ncbi:MAG: hypothetical protein K6T90_17590 [Leptolyngbyaceae cyanobacterium HOT.MB2.61]|nr:hypothetical protein [Leptolyngbyaceae cyanobacterium HOT.MB2.61]